MHCTPVDNVTYKQAGCFLPSVFDKLAWLDTEAACDFRTGL